MATVPAGGAGPAYMFEVGKFEITNAQFAAFLNEAELDGGATEAGAHMFFAADGGIYISNRKQEEDFLVATRTYDRTSNILFDPDAPAGRRYAAAPGTSNLPVAEVSWLGAVKFCNWLTLKTGLGPGQRAYTEGPTLDDWHPVTISKDDWLVRDLSDGERQALVIDIRGYRLPMDNLGAQQKAISNPENAFNEWYKAAAYDPNAPATGRVGPFGEFVSPNHWIYGFGADEIGVVDANFNASRGADSPGGTVGAAPVRVGFYNGINRLAGGRLTRDSRNPYGIYDVSGNVGEWLQDIVHVPTRRAAEVGGSFDAAGDQLAVTYRGSRNIYATHGVLGFRVLRVPVAPTSTP